MLPIHSVSIQFSYKYTNSSSINIEHLILTYTISQEYNNDSVGEYETENWQNTL